MPRRAASKDTAKSHQPPATTPEGREAQLVALAADLAEKRLRDGTASSGEIVAILKWGSQRERLERSKLASEKELLEAKVDNLASMQRSEEAYEKALAAFKSYQGEEDGDVEDF